ncbi:hypothetical protein [Paenibacillus sp. N3/727]|nr:hypothetical protein [Paenibacillus sp. N3/727]
MRDSREKRGNKTKLSGSEGKGFFCGYYAQIFFSSSLKKKIKTT